MAETLYPAPQTYTIPATVAQRASTAVPVDFGEDYLWDAETGDFAVDGGGNVLIADGRTAAEQWVEKVSVTQQGDYPIYPRGFGPDLLRAIGPGNQPRRRSDVEARLRTELVRALTPPVGDPRVRSVDNFTFAWTGDQLEATYTVTFADGSRARQTTEVAL